MSQMKRGLSSSSYSSDDRLKRPKSRHIVPQKETSSFVEGSIVRIKLKNFLTYDAVEFKTGPYLNVIIGPNGTGKSAIVCAICLGLAGKTNWLGRASEPKEFIKYGAEKAHIEIELFNPFDDSNYVIDREISSNKTSHWWINGRTTTQKAVEELVIGLNIQVGNLCQFLPQEKVADFARMSQQELLENTEKSVGRANLYENHQKLKAARQEARGLEQDVSNLKEQLDQEKQRNARIEQDVKSYNDRKTFLEKVEVLKMKRPWVEYERLKVQYERAREEKDRKSGELKEEMKRVTPLQRKHDNLQRQKEELETSTREMSQKIRSKAKDLEEQTNHMITKSEQIEEAKSDFDSKVKEEEARDKRLGDLKEQLKALQAGLAQIEGSDPQIIVRNLEKVNEDLRNVNAQMTSVQTDGERLRGEINQIKAEIRAHENQIRQIQDVNNRRLETLRAMHQNTYEAVMWLRANKSMFKHTIHEPMIICLNVTNAADAKLVEAHISFNDLRSFVCEDPDDLDLFMKKVKNEQKLRVNAIRAPNKPASSFQPQHPINHYKKYGFSHYMQSLFTCPEPVMRYLCMMYKVHTIPVGSTAIQRNSQRIIQECPELTNFYTPEVQYTIKRSKYDKSVSSRNTALREPRAFADSINVEREQELSNAIKESSRTQKEKEDKYKSLQRESEELEKKINEFREHKRNLMKQKDQRKNIENQITTKKQRIEQVMKEKINIPAENQKLQQQLKKIIVEKVKHLQKMKTVFGECLNIEKHRIEKSLLLAECVREFSIIETQLLNAKQRFEGLEKEVDELKDHVKDLKQQAREKLIEAKRIAHIGMNDKLEEELRKRGIWEEFKNASSQLDDLDNEIHSMQARAESMFQVDEQVVQEFEKREKEIEAMEKRLHERESRQRTHQEDISQAKKKWLEPLIELLREINKNFSYFFSCLNCCGEVSLSEPENPEDYEKYGVCIKVKFRDNETLRELTAHHQSGGERSVSTVLYMMALQELTKCPFRAVDEINQGMDPRNERKVFQLVVQTVCRKTASQYFLLTPKLLPDLEYDKNMTVLCIYNGKHMTGHKEWNLREFIRRRAALKD